MGFLLSHWHCILPVAVLAIGAFFMSRDKSKKQKSNKDYGENYDGDLQ